MKENVYLLDSTKGSFVYLIKGTENILIDTGLPFVRTGMIKELEHLGIRPEEINHILLTHSDMDHIGNLKYLMNLTDAYVWASEEDIPYIYGDIDRPSFKKYLKYIFPADIPKKIKPYIPGQNINGVEVIPSPGHTPGHVCLLFEDVLFVGDLFHNKKGKMEPYPKAWNWNQEKMMESAEKVGGIPFRWMCPAHGNPIEYR